MSIKNALVVDDSMSARVMLRRMLEKKQVAVDLAETAEEALEYLQSKKPDVVFMDHILPGMNGFDATKAISTDPNTSTIPVVMYTSKEGDTYLEQARAHGACGILRKPAKQAALAEIIAELARLVEAQAPVAAKATQAPAPAAAAQPSISTMSTVEIEKISRRIAEVIVQESVQTSVTRRLEEQLGPLRQDLLGRAKNTAKEVAAEVFAARSSDLYNQTKRYIHDQIADLKDNLEVTAGPDPAMMEEVKNVAMAAVTEAAAETATETARTVARLSAQNVAEQAAGVIARQVANELYAARAKEIPHQIHRHVQEQLSDVRAAMEAAKTLSPTILQEIKHLAQSTGSQAGAASATQAAEKTARHTALNVAEQAGENAGRAAAEEAVNAIRTEMKALYVAGGGLMALLIMGVLLYLLLGT